MYEVMVMVVQVIAIMRWWVIMMVAAETSVCVCVCRYVSGVPMLVRGAVAGEHVREILHRTTSE